MASRFSLQAHDRSVRSFSSFSHDGMESESHQDEPENDQTPLVRFLQDPCGSTVFERISLREAGSLPVHVFPARTRLPGELPPYRLTDGVSTTQPPRGRRRRTQMSTAIASNSSMDGHESTSGLPPPPQQPVSLPTTSHPPSAFISAFASSTSEQPSKRKDKAQLHVGSSEATLSPSSCYPEKQLGFSASASMISPWQGPPQAASHQQVCQQPELQPDRPCPPFGISSAPLNRSSSVMLPRNMVWHPDQALFAQNQPHQSTAPQPHLAQSPGSVAEDPYSEPSPYWPTSMSNSSFRGMQAVSMQSQRCSESGRPSPQDSNSNSESSIPSLTFHSPSSQPSSSRFDSSSNYSPPRPFAAQGGEQAEEPHAHSHILDQASDMSLLIGNEGEKVAGEDDEWEDLIDFGD